MKFWQEIKIIKNSLGEYMVYLATTNPKTKKITDNLQGIYKTRKRINKCISKCLNLLTNADCKQLQDKMKRTDTERLNALQNLRNGYCKGWMLRSSNYDNGLKLFETSLNGADPDIRIAIDNFLDKQKETKDD